MSNYEKNYYEILEIPYSAGPRTIEKAYYKTLGIYQDDSMAGYSLFSSTELEVKRAEVEEAYCVLSSEEKRKAYLESRGINVNVDMISDNKEEEHNAHVNLVEAKNKFKLDFTINDETEKLIEIENDFNGEFLKMVREYKNVSIERLAKLTNILKVYLIAIEEENFDALPATVYARGFIVQYCKILKLNPDLVASKYINRLKSYRNAKLS